MFDVSHLVPAPQHVIGGGQQWHSTPIASPASAAQTGDAFEATHRHTRLPPQICERVDDGSHPLESKRVLLRVSTDVMRDGVHPAGTENSNL